MGIERQGQFIMFRGEDGLKTFVRVSAIQIVAESDPSGDETFLTVANRIFLVRTPIDEVCDAVLADERLFAFRSGGRAI